VASSARIRKKRQARRPRVADMVADRLRDQVLSGQLIDGAMLPPQEQLIEDFGVSPPSLREAFRILETEGLLTTIRGNVGGAEVQVPRPERVAYLLSMVLQARGVSLDDVAVSLGELESLCAAMAARGDDRAAVGRTLRMRIEESRAAFDDTDSYIRLARKFHEDLVRSCGNETLIIVLGAVETLWSAHVDELTRATGEVAPFDDLAFRSHSLAAHVAIADAIEKGDSELAAQLARDHMHEPNKHKFMDSDLIVRSTAVRHAADEAGYRPAR
jgi:GntR family transcriptional regulator, transcriptional repressor for pyruvate dehydrogenase complex